MELNRTKNWFYILIGGATAFILLLGAWWLYLVFKLANRLQTSDLAVLEGNLVSMVKWEGFTFFVLLSILASALHYFFYQDHKKSKALQAFFASLTHELKTPLASIRLQSQVMDEQIDDLKISDAEKDSIRIYSKRLMQDTLTLEDQLDKHLQLSRLGKDEFIQLKPIDIKEHIQNFSKKYPSIEFNTSELSEDVILANDFTLNLILKNLVENTNRHNPNSKTIYFKSLSLERTVEINYDDRNEGFKGNSKKLGNLFYKHDSPKGSGIGLYLIKNLMKNNNGYLKINNDKSLNFSLIFQKGKDVI